MPEVSVIMSVKNGLPYLESTVNSVLNQTFKDFEFIIVNDGSTDNTAGILENYHDPRLQIINQGNTGVAAAKNRAVRQSSGNYIAVIDADDVWLSHKLQRQVDFLNQNPEYVLVGSYVQIIDKDGNYLYTEKKPVSDKENRHFNDIKNTWTHSACFFRRQAFYKAGCYYEPVKQYIVDYMLMYQLSQVGKVYQLPEVLVQYRIVPTSLSTKADGKAFREVMKKAIRRGTMTEQELQTMKDIKAGEIKTPDFKKSMYHLYLGRSFLFHNYKPRQSRKHLKQALKYNSSLYIAGIYWLMATFLPRKLLRIIYGKMSPMAGYTYVEK